MSNTHAVNQSVTANGTKTIGPGTLVESGGSMLAVDSVIPASSSGLLQSAAFTAAGVQSFVLLASTALTIRTNSPGVNAVQTLTITGTPTGGTFTMSFGGQTTAGIAYNAVASAVQSALVALSSVGTGQMVCTGGPLPGTPVVCTFGGTLGLAPEATMTASGAGLTGGSSPASAVASTTTGVAPGNTLVLVAGVPWVYDRSCGYYANPFTVDVTAFYLTNGASATGFQASILST